jgi:hypothetical protein
MLLIGVAATSCGTGSGPTDSVFTAGSTEQTARDTVATPLSLYVVIDVDEGVPSHSSTRTEDDLREIAERVSEIWSVAGVIFDPVEVHTIEVPGPILRDLAVGDPESFLAGAGREFEVPAPGMINGFYVAELFGVNGFAPAGTRAFFVVDRPTVHDERVSSHEIGHILGLHHDLDDPGRLMFGGTNGMSLTDTEIAVARYGVNGLLDAVR